MLLLLSIFCLYIPVCFTDLTGAHYLNTINCSSPSLYIPQGPYLFSHHWPFISITIQYQKQLTKGACYRNGTLYFMLHERKICSGVYLSGQAKLLCQHGINDYCLIHMKSSDGSPLACVGLTIKSISKISVVCSLLIAFCCKNRLFG